MASGLGLHLGRWRCGAPPPPTFAEPAAAPALSPEAGPEAAPRALAVSPPPLLQLAPPTAPETAPLGAETRERGAGTLTGERLQSPCALAGVTWLCGPGTQHSQGVSKNASFPFIFVVFRQSYFLVTSKSGHVTSERLDFGSATRFHPPLGWPLQTARDPDRDPPVKDKACGHDRPLRTGHEGPREPE